MVILYLQRRTLREGGGRAWGFSLHIVLFISSKELQIFELNFYSDQRIRTNIFTPLYLKSETSAYAQLAITCLYYSQIWWHGISRKLASRIPLGKWDLEITWSHDFFCQHFLVCNFLLRMPTFTQGIKTYQQSRFGKKAVYNLHTTIHF